MKIHVLSDLHLEYEDFSAVSVTDADLVVLAGDIAVSSQGVAWAKESFPDKPVIYVPGNHEYYGGEVGAVITEMRAEASDSNVRILDCEMLEVGDVRILGATLWTDFRLFAGDDEIEFAWALSDAQRSIPDYDGRIRLVEGDREIGLTPGVTQRWHHVAQAWLSQKLAIPYSGATVVVTHHAPTMSSVSAGFSRSSISAAFASNMDSLVSQATLWIHGHTHSAANYWIGKCHVVSNPRGYGKESECFNPHFILTI